MSHGLRWSSELDVNKTTARIVDTFSKSGGVEGHAGNAGKANQRVSLTSGTASAGTAGVESGPLTPSTSGAAHAGPVAIPSHPSTAGENPARSPKYGNVATDGEASKKQAKRLSELRLMNEAGLIRGLCRQPEYVLIPKQVRESGELIERKMTYIADYLYEEWTANGWRMVVEDAKGYATPGYVQKRKLLLRIHGIEVRET